MYYFIHVAGAFVQGNVELRYDPGHSRSTRGQSVNAFSSMMVPPDCDFILCTLLIIIMLFWSLPTERSQVFSEDKRETRRTNCGLDFHTVAGHLPDSDRESADSGGHLGLPVPDGQHLLAGVVVFQPVGSLATPRPAFPDLLRHVRLHGCSLHR